MPAQTCFLFVLDNIKKGNFERAYKWAKIVIKDFPKSPEAEKAKVIRALLSCTLSMLWEEYFPTIWDDGSEDYWWVEIADEETKKAMLEWGRKAIEDVREVLPLAGRPIRLRIEVVPIDSWKDDEEFFRWFCTEYLINGIARILEGEEALFSKSLEERIEMRRRREWEGEVLWPDFLMYCEAALGTIEEWEENIVGYQAHELRLRCKKVRELLKESQSGQVLGSEGRGAGI